MADRSKRATSRPRRQEARQTPSPVCLRLLHEIPSACTATWKLWGGQGLRQQGEAWPHLWQKDRFPESLGRKMGRSRDDAPVCVWGGGIWLPPSDAIWAWPWCLPQLTSCQALAGAAPGSAGSPPRRDRSFHCTVKSCSKQQPQAGRVGWRRRKRGQEGGRAPPKALTASACCAGG